MQFHQSFSSCSTKRYDCISPYRRRCPGSGGGSRGSRSSCSAQIDAPNTCSAWRRPPVGERLPTAGPPQPGQETRPLFSPSHVDQTGSSRRVISFMVSHWSIELQPEVEEWLATLLPSEFATVAFHVDRLSERGATLRMPHSRSLGGGLFELRFDLDRVAQRLTFFFPGERRVVLLTAFRKQRSNERSEVERARVSMRRCIEQGHTADDGGGE